MASDQEQKRRLQWMANSAGEFFVEEAEDWLPQMLQEFMPELVEMGVSAAEFTELAVVSFRQALLVVAKEALQ